MEPKLHFKISVVVSLVHHDWSAPQLGALMESLTKQTEPIHELVLVYSTRKPENLKTFSFLLRQISVDPEAPKFYALNSGAKVASGDFLIFMDAGDVLQKDATHDFSSLCASDEKVDFVYGDEKRKTSTGNQEVCKPAWSPELLYSQSYIGRGFAVKKSLFDEIGGFREGFSHAIYYDFTLRASLKAKKVANLERAVFVFSDRPSANSVADEMSALKDFFRVMGKNVRVEEGLLQGTFRTREVIQGTPLVSILIPTDYRVREVIHRGKINMVLHLIKGICEKTKYPNYEIVVVDNSNADEESRALFEKLNVKLVSFPDQNAKFNFSDRLNFAASRASGDFFIPLNDDTDVIEPGWIEALLELAQNPEVGVVGARLLYAEGSIQHAGVICTKEGEPKHALYKEEQLSPQDRLYGLTIRNFLAVTGACMMIRRDVWERSKGFDPKFAIDFNDIDFCLRIHTGGLRNVYTPFALLYHYDQSSLVARVQNPSEREEFFRRWRAVVSNDGFAVEFRHRS